MIGSALPYIPQRPPIVMIDYLIEADEKSGIGQFEVKDTTLFLKQGMLMEAGLIENIAQTAAAWAGYIQSKAQSQVRIGYIASLNNVSLYNLAPIGSIIKSSIEVQHTLLNISIILGKSYHGSTQLCQCELKIFTVTI